MKKYRIFWNQQKEEYLLRCYNHYRLTSSSDHGLKGKSWRRIAVRMSQEFNEEYDSKSCRNKMNVLRYDYANYKSLLEAKANGTETDEFWADLIMKSGRVIKWRDPATPFPYYDILRRILEENGGNYECPLVLTSFLTFFDCFLCISFCFRYFSLFFLFLFSCVLQRVLNRYRILKFRNYQQILLCQLYRQLRKEVEIV
jgi:hypothetical protein